MFNSAFSAMSHSASSLNFLILSDHHIDIFSSVPNRATVGDFLSAEEVRCPWDDSSMIEEKPPLTRQLSDFMEKPFRPWQERIYNELQRYNDRNIIFIYDCIDNSGKSIFTEFLEYQGVAFELPMIRSFEGLMEDLKKRQDY
jgi:hypothetical protein